VASNGSADQRRRLLTVLHGPRAAQGFSGSETTLADQGSLPTVALRKLTDGEGTIAVLAVTRSAATTQAAERAALQSLLLTALVATAVVSCLAVVLGRRTVEPVRRLTAAAQRVSSGDLSATAGVSARDEVGALSRTFDAMTGNLTRLTGDLRSSAVRLETVLASMSDGLLATDAAGLVTSVNRSALALLGLAEEQVLGQPIEEVADVRDPVGGQLADPGLRLLDEVGQVHRPDGTTVPVRVALTTLDDGDGVVLVLRDTTREREVERMKTEFLSNVSHELRTPLTPTRGYAEILLAKPGLAPEKVTTFASTIRDESLRMGRVVDLLVDVAALEAGRVSVVPRTTSVVELLDDRLATWRDKVPARAADLSRRVAGTLPCVQVDPSWVGKALDELIDNAVKYSPSGAPITLTASWAPGRARVRVAVRDGGPGIAAADRATLFSSFEQGRRLGHPSRRWPGAGPVLRPPAGRGCRLPADGPLHGRPRLGVRPGPAAGTDRSAAPAPPYPPDRFLAVAALVGRPGGRAPGPPSVQGREQGVGQPRYEIAAADALVVPRSARAKAQHALAAAVPQHPDGHAYLTPFGVLMREGCGVVDAVERGLGRRRQDHDLVREHHAEHLGPEHDPGQLLVQRTLSERLLRDRSQAPGPGRDQPHGGGQLGLGPQKLLGVHEREQLWRLVPPRLRQVALDLTDDRQQHRAHQHSLTQVSVVEFEQTRTA